MTRVLVFVILLVTFERTCIQQKATDTTPKSSIATDAAMELEILRTVFEYQIQQCYRDRNPDLYFLSYKEGDPADNIVQSLNTPQIAVQPRSQMLAFRNRDTGKPGILLAVQEIKLRTETSADATGSCGAAPLDGSSYIYHMVLKDGQWMVKNEKVTGRS